MGVAVYRVPQYSLREQLHFVVALFFSVCLGVGYAFFSIRHTWFHAEAVAVWMWKHVSTYFSATTPDYQVFPPPAAVCAAIQCKS